MITRIQQGCFGVLFLLLGISGYAVETTDNLGDVETNWPGIHYQIVVLKRILSDRLLVVVRVRAAAEAPPNGTLLGFPVPIPPNVNAVQAAFLYRPHPLSLRAAVMTDDSTQKTYPTLPPVAPPGKGFRSSETLMTLKPHQNVVLTIQFSVPPRPTDLPPLAPLKQTVSFLLPNSKGPITNVPLPPQDDTAATTP